MPLIEVLGFVKYKNILQGIVMEELVMDDIRCEIWIYVYWSLSSSPNSIWTALKVLSEGPIWMWYV